MFPITAALTRLTDDTSRVLGLNVNVGIHALRTFVVAQCCSSRQHALSIEQPSNATAETLRNLPPFQNCPCPPLQPRIACLQACSG
eukprot:5539884-Amphidinium_carterae.2